MAICKRERQPGWLFTLSDENSLIGIGHLVIGRSHGIASSRAWACQPPSAIIILHLASRLKPVNGPWGLQARFVEERSTGLVLAFRRKSERISLPRQFSENFTPLHCCNTRQAIDDEPRLRMPSSLVIRIAEDQDKSTNKYPASNRLGAGQYGRVDWAAGRKGRH
jgi:hypothetical protein